MPLRLSGGLPDEFAGEDAGKIFRAFAGEMTVVDADLYVVKFGEFSGVVKRNDGRGRGRLPEARGCLRDYRRDDEDRFGTRAPDPRRGVAVTTFCCRIEISQARLGNFPGKPLLEGSGSLGGHGVTAEAVAIAVRPEFQSSISEPFPFRRRKKIGRSSNIGELFPKQG